MIPVELLVAGFGLCMSAACFAGAAWFGTVWWIAGRIGVDADAGEDRT